MDRNNLAELSDRNIKAAALFETFDLEEMEKVLETNIFDLMGVSGDLSEEQKNDLLRIFQDTIQTRVVSRVLDMLDEKELDEFGKILESDTQAADKFLADKGVNKEQIAIVEMVLYKLELTRSKKVEGDK